MNSNFNNPTGGHMPDHRRLRGFTLIELVVTVAIVAILSALAYPSYRSYIERSYRSNAKTTLLDAAQFMERYRSSNFMYAADATTSPPTPPTLPSRLQVSPSDGASRYTITVTTPTSMSFTLTAQPSGWVDAKCGNLTLTNLGEKGQTIGDLATCWNK
jgi:type IV pilus assembly protein PilE